MTSGTRKKLQEFFLQSASATFGTVIGIILTFGTTLYLQEREQKKMERQSALIVIANLDHFSHGILEGLKCTEAEDSLNLYVWKNLDRLDKIPDDTLELFLDNFCQIDLFVCDNSAENIFTTNIDTWKNIGCSKFVEKAGECFAFKKLTIDVVNELRGKKLQVYDTLMAISACSEHPTNEPRETVKRLFERPITRLFIMKQHKYYSAWLKNAALALKEENAKNKELMQVTDEELKDFGDNDDTVYN